MSSKNNSCICVPLNETSLRALRSAAAKATTVADLIELRADGLDAEQLDDPAQLKNLVDIISRPVILTFRSSEEGGYRSLTRAQRRSFWQEHLRTNAALFDVELDLVTELTTLDGNEQPDWSHVICSHHDFTGVPQDLDAIYEQLAFTPARILKLAVTASDVADCIELFKLLERASREKRELIAIAMGNAGAITRILGPSWGSFLTYGACEIERGTAPGQLLASELKSVYRADQIDGDTMITGLVGSPVMHSVSPHMHNAAFQALGLNGVYLPFEVSDLGGFFKRLIDPRTKELDWNLRGLSVTAPHKVEVMKYLDWVDPKAQKIGAVNTVVLEDGRLLGYNTDADGLIQPLIQKLGSLAGLRAAVIGAGGAASAAIFALLQQGVEVNLYARNPDKAEAVSRRFNISWHHLGERNIGGLDIMINATPLGSLGKEIDNAPVLADQLRMCRLVYDLVYNPIETRFMREGREAGCEVLGGLEMLVVQAQLQFKLLTKNEVSYELMYAAGHSALTQNLSS